MTYLNTLSVRGHAALLTGLAGGATAQTMTVWGGDLERFLPPTLLLIAAACAGAAGAGALLSGALGQRGWPGGLSLALCWPLVTALGAVLAALPFGLADAGFGSCGIERLSAAVETSAPLGLLAVADGIGNSPVVACVWGLSALAVHAGLRAQRQLST